MDEKKSTEQIAPSKKAGTPKWAVRLSVLLFLFLLVEAAMTWFIPAGTTTQVVAQKSTEVTKVVDCMSCRWLMSEQAFRQGNYNLSIKALHGAQPNTAWYWAFMQQREQIEIYNKVRKSNQPKIKQWLGIVGVAVTFKDPMKYETVEARLRHSSILATYDSVIGALI